MSGGHSMATEADRRAAVVAAARRWIGTPWQHQARVLGAGCDCAGLIIMVARELGLADVDVTGYGTEPDGERLQALCDQYMHRVPLADVRPGDVLLMAFASPPRHLGIVGDYPGGGLSLIHAYAQMRKVVEHRLDAEWMGRAVAAYRLPGVAEVADE